MLTNWEVTDATDPYASVRAWASGLDVHLVMRELLPVTSYIEMWLAGFDARKVTLIDMGYLALGRSDSVVITQELRGMAPPNLHEYMERIWSRSGPGQEAL